MTSYDSLIKDFNNLVVELEKLNSVLGNLRDLIIRHWNELKGETYVKESLGMRHYTFPTNVKLNVLLNEKLPHEYALPLLAGFGISDLHVGSLLSTSTPDLKLISSMLYVIGSLMNSRNIIAYFQPTAVIRSNGELSIYYHMALRGNNEVKKLIINELQIKSMPLSNVPEYLRQWLNNSLSGGGLSKRLKKQLRIIYYMVNGFITRDSVFTWFMGDGVLGHVGRGSFDVGFSFVVDPLVRAFMDSYLCGLYGCSGRFFGSSVAGGSEHYVVCPVKALVINDVVSWVSRWPKYGLTGRVVKLVDAAKYSTPCLTYAKYPIINILGHDLILRKHNVGRGWYLSKATSDEKSAMSILSDLKNAGFNVNVNKHGNMLVLYVPIEDTRRVLRMIGLYERFYGSRVLPSLDDVVKVLGGFRVRGWHVHVARGRNGRGYEYAEACLLISLGDSLMARGLRDELTGLGVRVRKVVWGTVIVCSPEDRELLMRALTLLVPGNG
ncbi:MAG: hypothetical protein ACP5L1_03585 [Caldivirga sp.]|uniref:hypothetical protein n=1 Tax=Caldivirga sp. TaxID=2080243 RepID=UPI003D0CA073